MRWSRAAGDNPGLPPTDLTHRSMKLHTLVTVLVLAPIAVAQGTTATDFGVAATHGTASGFDGKPKGTPITPKTPLRVGAAANYSSARAFAYAYTHGLSISEYGSAYVRTGSSAKSAAGTTTDKSGAIGAPHGVNSTITAKAGTKGRLVISWYRTASKTGVNLRAGVTSGSSSVASFTHADAAKTVYVNVTIPSSGKLNIGVTTSGRAAVSATPATTAR